MGRKPAIAITGRPGSGSSTIAKGVAKKLGYIWFSPGKFFKTHSRAKDETDQALSEWKTEEGKSKKLHESIEEIQSNLAKRGGIVISGKLSIWALRDIADVKIWLECGLDERARRTSKRDKIPVEEAKKKIVERERLERNGWKKIYGIDYFEQKKMADFVIDNTNLKVEETVAKVLEKIPKV